MNIKDYIIVAIKDLRDRITMKNEENMTEKKEWLEPKMVKLELKETKSGANPDTSETFIVSPS